MGSYLLERVRKAGRRVIRPARLVNWLHARSERQSHPDSVRSFPIRIDVEPTTRCNLRCRTCQRAVGDWPEVDLSVERFESILDQLPTLEEIKLMGVGEPLLNPRFFDLVRRARRRRIRVWTITNGTTLDLQEHRREILESGLGELRVSIDGATPETHARWRSGSDLDRILDGLRRLVELRGRARRPQLGIWSVGNHDNLAELPALVNLAANLKLDALTYETQMSSWGKEEVFARIEKYQIDRRSHEFTRKLDEAQKQARRRGLTFAVWEVDQSSAERPCSWPWASCLVSAGGEVTRCFIACDPRLHNFGQIDDTRFEVIWNSPEYQNFRRAHRENDIPLLCRMCYGVAEHPEADTQSDQVATSGPCDAASGHSGTT